MCKIFYVGKGTVKKATEIEDLGYYISHMGVVYYPSSMGEYALDLNTVDYGSQYYIYFDQEMGMYDLLKADGTRGEADYSSDLDDEDALYILPKAFINFEEDLGLPIEVEDHAQLEDFHFEFNNPFIQESERTPYDFLQEIEQSPYDFMCHESHCDGWGCECCSNEWKAKKINTTENTIFFSKVKPDAIIPSKRDEDAGYDIYACFDDEGDVVIILPNETQLIPTGVATAFSKDWVAIIKERGSTGTKGMGQRCGVIDSGFRGQWFVPITNHNNVPLVITQIPDSIVKHAMEDQEYIYYPTTKAIAQFIMLPVPQLDTVEIPYDELLEITSERGMGALGSSSK